MEIRRVAVGADHTATLDTMSNLAVIQQAAGRADDARETLTELLRLTEAKHGPDDSAVAEVLTALARHDSEARVAGAKEQFERALSILERAHGAGAPELLRTLLALTEHGLRTARFDEAIADGRRALPIASAGGGDSALASVEFVLAKALHEAPAPARDREQSVQLAESARERARADGDEDAVAEMTAWLDARQ